MGLGMLEASSRVCINVYIQIYIYKCIFTNVYIQMYILRTGGAAGQGQTATNANLADTCARAMSDAQRQGEHGRTCQQESEGAFLPLPCCPSRAPATLASRPARVCYPESSYLSALRLGCSYISLPRSSYNSKSLTTFTFVAYCGFLNSSVTSSAASPAEPVRSSRSIGYGECVASCK